MKHIIYSLAIAMVIFSVQPTNCFAEHLPPVLPILPGSNHEHEDLSGLDLSDQELTNINFNHIKVVGTDFDASVLDNSTFLGVDFSNGIPDTLSDTQLNSTIFDDAIFIGLDFREVFGVGASFRNVDFTGADFDDSDLMDSDFTGAIIRNVDLGEFDARNSDFTGVDFSGSDIGGQALFQGAILVDTIFDDAIIYFAENHYRNADMRGADISQLKLESSQQDFGQIFAGAFYDNTTTFPLVFNPIAGGMIFVPEPKSYSIVITMFFSLLSFLTWRRINFLKYFSKQTV